MTRARGGTERTFWERFHALRKRRLPTRSGVYELLDQHYRKQRARFARDWKREYDTALPEPTRRFYNGEFARVQQMVRRLLEPSAVAAGQRRAADEAYALRLEDGARLRDLLAADVFGDKSENQDIPPKRALTGIVRREIDARLVNETHHFFLHRPQRTEVLFLHESIVGYLGNVLHNGGEVPSRGKLPLSPTDYWLLPAYSVKLIASLLGRPEVDVVALHFADNDHVRAILPQSIQDVMLAAAHVYWFFDVNAKIAARGQSPVEVLNLLHSFFVIPSLERVGSDPGLALRPDAGAIVDEHMEDLLGGGPERIRTRNDVDLARLLLTLGGDVFTSRARRR